MKLQATIHFGAPSGGRFDGAEQLRITVDDEASNLQIAEICLPLADFGKIIAARVIGCTVDLNTSPNIGKQHENKTVWVDHPRTYCRDTDLAALRAAVAPYCVDGWTPDEDLGTRRRQDGAKHEITMRRWV